LDQRTTPFLQLGHREHGAGRGFDADRDDLFRRGLVPESFAKT
jgi:hypothetical protein